MTEQDRRIKVFLKKVKKRIWGNIFLNALVSYLGIGFVFGIAAQVVALFIPIYHSTIFAWMLLGSVVVLGLLFHLFHLPDGRTTALIVDEKGMDEKMITSLELVGKDDVLSHLQKETTLEEIQIFSMKKEFPYSLAFHKVVFLSVAAVTFIIAGMIPSQAKEKAIADYNRKEKIQEQKEKVEEVKKEIQNIQELSKEDSKAWEKALETAKKEFDRAEDTKELKRAKERLKTKLDQQLKNQKNQQVAQQLEEVLKKNRLAKENSNQQLDDTKKVLEQQIKQLEKLQQSLDNEQLKKVVSQLKDVVDSNQLQASQLQQLQQQAQQLSEELDQGTISAKSLSEMTDKLENMAKAGGSGKNAQGQAGQGGQTGQGGQGGQQNANTLSSSGNGLGNGKNYGSKDGLEKEQEKTEDKVAVSAKKTGNDGNLTGTAKKEGSSYHAETGDGVTWKGNSVSYDKVVKKYTKEAYSDIENGEVPEEMKPVVKSYFEKLNEE